MSESASIQKLHSLLDANGIEHSGYARDAEGASERVGLLIASRVATQEVVKRQARQLRELEARYAELAEVARAVGDDLPVLIPAVEVGREAISLELPRVKRFRDSLERLGELVAEASDA